MSPARRAAARAASQAPPVSGFFAACRYRSRASVASCGRASTLQTRSSRRAAVAWARPGRARRRLRGLYRLGKRDGIGPRRRRPSRLARPGEAGGVPRRVRRRSPARTWLPRRSPATANAARRSTTPAAARPGSPPRPMGLLMPRPWGLCWRVRRQVTKVPDDDDATDLRECAEPRKPYVDARAMVDAYLAPQRPVAPAQGSTSAFASGYTLVRKGSASVGINVLEDHGVILFVAPVIQVPIVGKETLYRKLLELSFLTTSQPLPSRSTHSATRSWCARCAGSRASTTRSSRTCSRRSGRWPTNGTTRSAQSSGSPRAEAGGIPPQRRYGLLAGMTFTAERAAVRCPPRVSC